MRLAALAVAVAFVLSLAGLASASPDSRSSHDLKLRAARQAATLRHDRDVLRFFVRHARLAKTPAGRRARRFSRAETAWTTRELGETRTSLEALTRGSCGASPAACAWYWDGATQCEVAHEGGFGSVSPDGVYAGRFQSDQSFEQETVFGREMEARYGRANNWPEGAQIEHAFEVFSYSGWSRWPPYAKYGCAAYRGGHYG